MNSMALEVAGFVRVNLSTLLMIHDRKKNRITDIIVFDFKRF